jgi:hypothetical protein
MSPSTAFSTNVTSVVCRPPPIQANCPAFAAAAKPSTRKLSGPQTNLGRIDTVAKSAVFASSTIFSATAFTAQ